MKIRAFVISFFTLSATFAIAAQSLSDKVNLLSSYALDFRGDLWQNPALYYRYTPFSWTDVKVGGYINDKGAASLRQEGDKVSLYGLDVNSFVILNDHNRVFGTAGYNVDKLKNVLWNENIDWALVAPYVTGDSIGGFLNGETYFLSGGYAAEVERWSWGGEAKYRAAHNYRDKDPRPYNTASDLSILAGGSYCLGSYHIGVSADFRLYQQNSSISFLADKGSTSVYHMLGLGMDYVRFAGNQTGVKYHGIQCGAAVALLPNDTDNGISASLAIDRMAMDKKLTSANNLTLLNLATSDISADVAWMRRISSMELVGVKLNADFTSRKGKEYVYGEAGGTSFGTLINKAPGVAITCAGISLNALWQRLPSASNRWGGALFPNVAYRSTSTDYKSSARKFDVSSVEAAISARLQYQPSRLTITAEANGGYCANISSDYILAGLNTSKSVGKTLVENINYLSDSYATAGISLRADYTLTKQYALSLAIRYQASMYNECGTANFAACSFGLIF